MRGMVGATWERRAERLQRRCGIARRADEAIRAHARGARGLKCFRTLMLNQPSGRGTTAVSLLSGKGRCRCVVARHGGVCDSLSVARNRISVGQTTMTLRDDTPEAS
jgi:hypothetical protein